MTIYLYKISFPNNPKVYIGQTTEPNTRFTKHCRIAKIGPVLKNGKPNKSFQHIHNALNCYGKETAIFEVLSGKIKFHRDIIKVELIS